MARSGMPDGNVLIVLDGLDEVRPNDSQPLIELLTILNDHTAPGLRLLLTARPGVMADRVSAQV